MPPGPIRLFLLDNRCLTRSLLEHAFANEPEFDVVGSARDADEARVLLRQAVVPIDVAIVNLALPGDSAIDLLPEFHARFPQCRLVGIDASPGQGRRRALAVASGAAVALAADADFADLVRVARLAHNGEALIAPNELHNLLRDATKWRATDEKARVKLVRLTPREVEILKALARGCSDKDIAADLQVKGKTVATHVANVLDKLEVASRLQAALLAIRYEFVDIGRD